MNGALADAQLITATGRWSGLSQFGQLGRLDIRPAQIELRRMPVVGAVTDQHEPQRRRLFAGRVRQKFLQPIAIRAVVASASPTSANSAPPFSAATRHRSLHS